MIQAGFDELGRALRRDLEPFREQSREEHVAVRRSILQALAPAGGEQPGVLRRFWWTAPAAAALVIGALLVWPGASESTLTFWVEDRRGEVDQWVTARDEPQALRFSDGTTVTIGARTTARVIDVAEHGARLTLERGVLDAHVVHRENSRWQVAAGPFVVRVTGTRFHVTWDPQAETLGVTVSEGRVEVSGGGHPEHELVAGSGLELRLRDEPVSALLPTAPSAQAPAPEAAPPPSGDARGRQVVEARTDWRELATNGRYREALALVEQQGFAAQCGVLPAHDLLTLASAARLAARSDRASEAYLAVRRRFPAASEAALAAFSLGRLASASDARGAIRWFEAYLAEQPGGQLAREASGRVMELSRQVGDAAKARVAAQTYLQRYPDGPHAALARSILAAR